MAWAFSTTAKNARANAINTLCSTGPKLMIYTSAYSTLLATFVWTGSLWASASNGVLTMNAPTTNPVTPAANGVAAIAAIRLADGTTDVISGLVVGTDVVLSNNTLATTAPVTLTAVTITEAA